MLDSRKEQLLESYSEIVDVARRGASSEDELRRVRAEIIALERFRTPETAAFLDLAKAELIDWADGTDVPKPVADERERRVIELIHLLWPGRA